jgi:hypothetical protein
MALLATLTAREERPSQLLHTCDSGVHCACAAACHASLAALPLVCFFLQAPPTNVTQNSPAAGSQKRESSVSCSSSAHCSQGSPPPDSYRSSSP